MLPKPTKLVLLPKVKRILSRYPDFAKHVKLSGENRIILIEKQSLELQNVVVMLEFVSLQLGLLCGMQEGHLRMGNEKALEKEVRH
jgi:hypothetical protein